MHKINTITIALSVVLSVISSTLAVFLFNLHGKPDLSNVIRAKRIELVDESGQILGVFGLEHMGKSPEVPVLILRGPNGQDSVQLQVDPRGDGDLSFGNDYWQEGAIILGHLSNVDDGTESKSRSFEDKRGSWGLQVRSKENKLTSLGFFNSGKPMVPLTVPPP